MKELNNMQSIRIKTKAGKMIYRKAYVIDKIDNEGNRFSIAIVGRSVYYVTDRYYDGAIWSIK